MRRGEDGAPTEEWGGGLRASPLLDVEAPPGLSAELERSVSMEVGLKKWRVRMGKCK